MKKELRPYLILAGILLVYAAALVFIARPIARPSMALPAVSPSSNVPYSLYLRVMLGLLGHGAGAVMVANALLMILTGGLVFRAGWALADPRYRLLSATIALVLFQFSPLAMILPLTLGFLGGFLLVPFFLMVFINTLVNVENWSAFMRAVMLSVAWSLFLWVHLPTAVLVLTALVPWVLCGRRPASGIGLPVTVLLLGTIIFTWIWALGCLAAHRWAMVQGPSDVFFALGRYLRQGLALPLQQAGDPALMQRLIHILAWLSPFYLIFGIWTGARLIRDLWVHRRSVPIDLVALISLAVLGVVILTPGKDTLPAAWYLLVLGALWSPLVAASLSKRENFYSRGFRWTFLGSFIVASGTLVILQAGPARGLLLPDATGLIAVSGAIFVMAGVFHALLMSRPVAIEDRLQAVLAGAMSGYFIVVDCLLLR
jgi:hypothetical protein